VTNIVEVSGHRDCAHTEEEIRPNTASAWGSILVFYSDNVDDEARDCT